MAQFMSQYDASSLCSTSSFNGIFFSQDTVANRHFEIISIAVHTGNTKGQVTVVWNTEQDGQRTCNVTLRSVPVTTVIMKKQ